MFYFTKFLILIPKTWKYNKLLYRTTVIKYNKHKMGLTIFDTVYTF